jgi:hypothetical protein
LTKRYRFVIIYIKSLERGEACSGGTSTPLKIHKEVVKMAVPKDREPVVTGVTAENALDKFNGLVSDMQSNPEIAAKLGETIVGNPFSLGSRVLSADEWGDKMVKRASNASADWLNGVLKPRKNPKEAAIKANAKRKDRLAQAEKDEKWLKAMQNVDEEETIATIKAVGEQGFKSGIEARAGKIKKKIEKLQPMISAVAATIDAMPDATDTDREKRMLTNLKLMREVGKKMAGG